MKRTGTLFIALSLAGCQDLHRADSAHAHATASPMQGVFDNHEQIWRDREAAPGGALPPHVLVSIDATPQADWSIWRIRFEATPVLEATWAFRSVAEANGAMAWIPYRSLIAAPAEASAFDPKQWAPLDACTLRSATRGAASLQVNADVAACTAIAPGIGAQAALLPLGFEREGEWLHIRLYADQARGADAREDARLVRWFGGWAAINGGGPKADAASRDWHMNRGLRIGSEGGRFELNWRDSSPSGYSLTLERLTYREGNVPVIKLSIVEDASGNALAYSWANPEATAIGINLGWVQVGLQREAAGTAPPK
jgi:hypothetical protein